MKELLEFTRQTRHLMQPNDINQAIDRTLFLLENQSLFQNIEIEKSLAKNLPLVRSDIQQMNHLLMNITLNAAQAMNGRGKLKLKTLPLENDRIRIEIADTGKGIAKEEMNQLFQPFFSKSPEGTGLGLVITKKIVEDHNGSICIESEQGIGTTVFVTMPVDT